MESTAQSHSPTIVFVLGPPGAGKGTLCELAANMPCVADRRYRHLSVGDYLRELCKSEFPCIDQSFDCDKIRNHIRESKLLPADVLIPVLKHQIISIPNDETATTAWLIDGFPRNMETALAFEEKVGPLDCV